MDSCDDGGGQHKKWSSRNGPAATRANTFWLSEEAKGGEQGETALSPAARPDGRRGAVHGPRTCRLRRKGWRTSRESPPFQPAADRQHSLQSAAALPPDPGDPWARRETADRRRSAGDRLRRLGRPDLRRDMRTRRCGRRSLGPLVGGFFLPAGREYPGFSRTDRHRNGAGRAGGAFAPDQPWRGHPPACLCLPGLGPENYLLFDIQPGLCAP